MMWIVGNTITKKVHENHVIWQRVNYGVSDICLGARSELLTTQGGSAQRYVTQISELHEVPLVTFIGECTIIRGHSLQVL